MRWKKIKNFPSYPEFDGLYMVSDTGLVKALPKSTRHRERLLNPKPSKKGYYMLTLGVNGKSHRIQAHRLVAHAFIPNPLGLPQVNHLNGIGTDNRVENLEWCTSKQNIYHRDHILRNGLRDGGRRPRKIKCVETGAVYPSCNEAARQLGLTRSNIHMLFRSCKHHSVRGYHFIELKEKKEK